MARHPEWAIGYEDEVWWSRLAHPCLSTWSDDGQPLHLIEQTVAKDDPDPKALAWYGLLVRWADPLPERRSEQMWLRFLAERPVSAVTTELLDWCYHLPGRGTQDRPGAGLGQRLLACQ